MTSEFEGVDSRDASALVVLSELDELIEYMDDDILQEMIDLAIKCLAQPHLKQETAEQLLLQFQAAAFKFGMLAVTYTTLKRGKAGTDENNKKNIYYTAADQCDKMAASLKYVVRRHA